MQEIVNHYMPKTHETVQRSGLQFSTCLLANTATYRRHFDLIPLPTSRPPSNFGFVCFLQEYGWCQSLTS